MSTKQSRHQRRRRGPNQMWRFDVIIWLAKAAYFVARILFFIDRE